MPAGGGGGGGALISPVPASQREESGVGLLDQGRAWTEWTGPTSHTCGSAQLCTPHCTLHSVHTSFMQIRISIISADCPLVPILLIPCFITHVNTSTVQE